MWGYFSIWVILGTIGAYLALALFVQRAIRTIPRYNTALGFITDATIGALNRRQELWQREASARHVRRCARLFLLIPPWLYRLFGIPKTELQETAKWAADALRISRT